MWQKFLIFFVVVVTLAVIPVAEASITFKILTDEDMSSPVFAGRSTGLVGSDAMGADEDIFWQGEGRDLNLLDLPGVSESTIGRNSVGSSSITHADFSGNLVRSYAVGETVYAGPIVFGINTIKSVSRQIETERFTNGLDGEAQSVLGLQTVIFSPDNTFSYDNLSSQNSTHEFSATTRHGYFLRAGEDPAVVFADPAQFANVDPLVTRQGVIDQFNLIIANITRSDWKILTVELVDFVAVQKPDASSTLGNFSGQIFGTSFVSFDRDSAPIERTLVAAVLPSSRAALVGEPVTFFAVMINAGTTAATGCRASPNIGPVGAFDFFTTNPNTNEIIGAADASFDLPPGGSQTMVFSVTPSLEFPVNDLPIGYRCDSGNPATSVVGVNTLLLSASTAPVADIVGLTTVVDLIAPEGATTLFGVASVNLGIEETITVSLDTGGVPVPVNLSLCQTDPALGGCSGDIGPEVTLTYEEQQVATFAVFVETTGEIINNANAHRVFLRFRDSAGIVRGATTTAVRTE